MRLLVFFKTGQSERAGAKALFCRVMDQRLLVALEVAQQLADVPLKTFDAGHVTQRFALRPATEDHIDPAWVVLD